MKLCVLVPAYQCAETIEEVCRRIPLPGPDDEILVVDDGSRDETLAVASRQPRVFAVRNETNLGYGGTSRRLYRLALARGADLTVNVHGDLGHKPEEIPRIVEALATTGADVVVGSRLLFLKERGRAHGYARLFADDALRAGMPRSRLAGHLVLTALQNRVYGSRLHSFHEGMRGCVRRVVEWAAAADFPARYTFDNELLFQAFRKGFRIGEIPVPPSYDSRAKVAAPRTRYGLKVLAHVARVAFTGR